MDGEQIIIMGTVFKNVPTNSLIPLDENPFFNKKKQVIDRSDYICFKGTEKHMFHLTETNLDWPSDRLITESDFFFPKDPGQVLGFN